MAVRALIVTVAVLVCASSHSFAAGTATKWSVGHKSKARLIIGSAPGRSGKVELYAGVEIALSKDWKTYWRHPGDAGGVPPYFDWSRSRNLKKADVSYPAPHRFVEQLGDSIGYKKHLVLPIRIEPQVEGQKIGLAVHLQYGVCREICIPAQAKLALEFSPSELRAMPPQLLTALESVPMAEDRRSQNSPRPVRVDAQLDGKQPRLVIDVVYPGGTDEADLFVEAGTDLYLPMAQRIKSLGPNKIRYEVDLSKDIEIASLHGRQLRLTMVSASESAEAIHKLP